MKSVNAHDDRIRGHYAGKTLPSRTVEAVLAEGRRTDRRSAARHLSVFAAAAVLILAFFLHDRYPGSDVSTRVLAEIAMNHTKQLDVEVATARYDVLQTGLDRLDFAVGPPDPSFSETHTLIGGRYCSIQGELAAQLKLRDTTTGAIETLYITRTNAHLRSIHPQTTSHDGVPIRLWQTERRFFGLAGGHDH